MEWTGLILDSRAWDAKRFQQGGILQVLTQAESQLLTQNYLSGHAMFQYIKNKYFECLRVCLSQNHSMYIFSIWVIAKIFDWKPTNNNIRNKFDIRPASHEDKDELLQCQVGMCIHGISFLLFQEDLVLEDVLAGLLSLLPSI